MRIAVEDNDELLAQHAAGVMAAAATRSVEQRGVFTVALSGGRTPIPALRALARLDLPWDRTHVFQVDERLVPRDHPDRNLTAIERNLVELLPTPRPHLHPLLVTDDPVAGAEAYAHELQLTCGHPPVLDLVQLGLGSDGHTASLFPDDAASLRARADVTVTQSAARHRRATLTIPVLRRARQQLWIVAGPAKAGAVRRLVDGDDTPASRVSGPDALLLLDAAAAAELRPGSKAAGRSSER